ncbi:MAG: phosphoglycerate mutase family protein [Saprospiraceae bacterium]
MKTLIPLLIAVLSSFTSFAGTNLTLADSTEFVTIILVRHGEKATADPDTELAPAGQERAKRLAMLLKDINVDEFYSTPFKRTQGTIAPLAQLQKKEVATYKTNDLKGFADSIRNKWGKTILIAGHSNTTPTLTNLLLQKERFAALSDDEYGKVFFVTIHKSGATQVKVLNY